MNIFLFAGLGLFVLYLSGLADSFGAFFLWGCALVGGIGVLWTRRIDVILFVIIFGLLVWSVYAGGWMWFLGAVLFFIAVGFLINQLFQPSLEDEKQRFNEKLAVARARCSTHTPHTLIPYKLGRRDTHIVTAYLKLKECDYETARFIIENFFSYFNHSKEDLRCDLKLTFNLGSRDAIDIDIEDPDAVIAYARKKAIGVVNSIYDTRVDSVSWYDHISIDVEIGAFDDGDMMKASEQDIFLMFY
jgi:hypothetical protein